MIYFDHAATTAVSDKVLARMKPYFSQKYGNPSSIYSLGREAKEELCRARQVAAKLVGAKKPGEIIFTSGATESNNLAIKGVAIYAEKVLNIKPHILISAIEHHSMLDAGKFLAKYLGYQVEFIPTDSEGRVDPLTAQKMIKDNTVFVSVMYGNNEAGTLEPIKKIGEMLETEKTKRKLAKNINPLVFHTDAVQAFQYFDCDTARLKVDMLSLTAHKFNGPKGVGLLYFRNEAALLPQQQGGTQEKGHRAGTENLAYIVGMVEAMRMASGKREENEQAVSHLTDYLIERVKKEIPDTELIGPKDPKKRLPHIATFLFKKVEGESVLIKLDQVDIAASSGSACTSGSLEPSHVTKALGFSDVEAHSSVRFSLAKTNSKAEIDELMKHLPKMVKDLRAMSPLN